MTPEEAETAKLIARGFLGVALSRRDTKQEARGHERTVWKRHAGARRIPYATRDGGMFAALEFTGEDTRLLLDAARRGDLNAHTALIEIAADLTDRDKRLPLPLQEYIVRDAPAFKMPKGRQKGSDWIKHAAIAGAVAALAEVNGFNCYRNKTTKEHSACSVVAEILRERRIPVTEKAVERDYELYRELAAALFFEGGVIKPRPHQSENK